MSDEQLWWEAKPGRVHEAVLTAVKMIEQNQSDVFERFHKLELLYDPNSPLLSDATDENRRGGVQENVIASNVDANYAAIATTDIRPRQMTDGADWHQQRRARKLEKYAEEQNKTFRMMPNCRAAYKEAAKKGNGLVKVTRRKKKPVVRHVMVENIVVDQNETRNDQAPTHMHEWVDVDADELIAEFPKYKAQIKAAASNRQSWRIDGRVFPRVPNRVVYLDSYRLPIGDPDDKDYVPGRHVKSLPQCTLLDEEWKKPFFPYAVLTFIKRAKSWYGISGAERVAGIQRALNKRNWVIEKQNDNVAVPTTWVRPADAGVATKQTRIGNVGVIRGDYPHTVMAPAVNPETYKSRLDLIDAGNREFGQSQMATHGTKPAGLDSGVALREFKDQTSDRYSPQEQGFEELVLEGTWLLLDVCKDLGPDAPVAVRTSRFGSRKIKWSDVDMGEVRIQLYAASNLPRTPAGRMQFVIELSQAGVISQDSARRLLQHPDLESELSLYTAALEAVEQCLDEIAEGRQVVPDPFMNAAMARWRGQMEYLKWLTDGAPESRLETLRSFVVTSVWIENRSKMAANANTPLGAQQPGDPAAAAAAGPGGAMPPMPDGPPPTPPPQAAFAPQAMTLMAGTG